MNGSEAGLFVLPCSRYNKKNWWAREDWEHPLVAFRYEHIEVAKSRFFDLPKWTTSSERLNNESQRSLDSPMIICIFVSIIAKSALVLVINFVEKQCFDEINESAKSVPQQSAAHDFEEVSGWTRGIVVGSTDSFGCQLELLIREAARSEALVGGHQDRYTVVGSNSKGPTEGLWPEELFATWLSTRFMVRDGCRDPTSRSWAAMWVLSKTTAPYAWGRAPYLKSDYLDIAESHARSSILDDRAIELWC